MKRREFIVLVVGLLASSLRAIAQHTPRLWRIGLVLPQSGIAHELVIAFQEKLGSAGYVDGKDIAISPRVVSPDPRSFEDAIQEMAPRVDLLVVWSTVGGVAAKRKAPNVPTIFISVGAPINIGLVASLARPGGNMTGVTFEAADETYGKRLQILKEVVPNLMRVAVL